MENFIYILKIILYFLLIFTMYYMALYYKKTDLTIKKKIKMTLFGILILCCVFGLYSIICGQIPYASDRKNFAIRFASEYYAPSVKLESLGLYWLQNILHLFTYEPNVLFFVCTFISVFFTLCAYRLSDDAEPLVLLLLGLSSYFTFTFYMFKQSIAVGLITVSFVAFNKKRKLLCILSLILAISFHESAWIILPLYFAIYVSKNNYMRIFSYVFLFLVLIFFKDISTILVKIASSIIPGLEEQLSYYLSDNGTLELGNNFLTIFKGIPFYYITIYAFYKRKELRDKIKNYDKYLFCSCFVSITILLSYYMYWLFRFGIYCYFPVFIFAALIIKELKKQSNKLFFSVSLIASLFVLILRLWVQYYFWYGGI